jgi:hypothetical protein
MGAALLALAVAAVFAPSFLRSEGFAAPFAAAAPLAAAASDGLTELAASSRSLFENTLVDAAISTCTALTPAGTFDLAPIGTLHALSPSNERTLGWLFAFNICENVDTSKVAQHCAKKAPAPAVVAGVNPHCRVLGQLSQRSFQPLEEKRVGVRVTFGDGEVTSPVDGEDDACGVHPRAISIDIVCADFARASTRLHENATRPCGYLAHVESRAGCPLACARDPASGAVCGGEGRGVCSMEVAGAAAACVCASGHSGPACSLDYRGTAAATEIWATAAPLFCMGAAGVCAFLLCLGAWLGRAGFLQTPASSSVSTHDFGTLRVEVVRLKSGIWTLSLAVKAAFFICGALLSTQELAAPSLSITGLARGYSHRGRPKATCAFASVGGTFRFGGQTTLYEGAIESYDDQISATQSHVALLQAMWKEHQLVCDIFFMSYNSSFAQDLKAIFQDAWPHRLALFRVLKKTSQYGFDELVSQVLEAALPEATLNSTPYDVLHYIRADMRLKPYFARMFDPLDADRILFASLINAQRDSTKDRRGYGKGRPWINEMAMSVPRKFFHALRPGDAVLRGQGILDHGS